MDKVKVALVGVDGNAFSLMAAWGRAARRQGWDQAEIDAVLEKARSGDYQHLVRTLADHSNEEAVFGSGEEGEYGLEEDADDEA